jgi:hypothetical protein
LCGRTILLSAPARRRRGPLQKRENESPHVPRSPHLVASLAPLRAGEPHLIPAAKPLPMRVHLVLAPGWGPAPGLARRAADDGARGEGAAHIPTRRFPRRPCPSCGRKQWPPTGLTHGRPTNSNAAGKEKNATGVMQGGPVGGAGVQQRCGGFSPSGCQSKGNGQTSQEQTNPHPHPLQHRHPYPRDDSASGQPLRHSSNRSVRSQHWSTRLPVAAVSPNPHRQAGTHRQVLRFVMPMNMCL